MTVKVSEAFVDTQEGYSDTKNEKPIEEKVRDKFFLTHITFFLLGIMHFLVITFFITANSYWMYKFRDTTSETVDTNKKTNLQSYFTSLTTVSQTVPLILCTIITTFYGHKIRAVPRVFFTLLIEAIAFFIATCFVRINTDSWQTGFFIQTMLLVAIISGANAFNYAGVLVVLSRFPDKYMKIYLIGEGVSGIFNGLMQVISIATGSSIINSATKFFVTGTSAIFVTLILFFLTTKSKHFRFYMEKDEEDTKKRVSTFSEMKQVSKDIWPNICLVFNIFLSILAAHPSTTALIVSEMSGTEWGDKYFTPVTTFLYPEVCNLLGRCLANIKYWNMSKTTMVILSTLRTLLFVPLLWMCNSQPRSHLPVLFYHDWQYAIIIGVFTFTFGYLITNSMLNVNRSVQPEKLEVAYTVIMLSIGVFGGVLSPVGVFAVAVL